jgi:hypothetical protein
MSYQRCLQILTLCMMLVLTGELVFARGEYITDNSDGNAKTVQEEKAHQISRLELQKGLMRFAQMFIRDFTLKVYYLERENNSNAVRFVLSSGELRTVSTLLHITTGPDAVVNLLDMVIFVTLGRMAVEKSWKPELLGKNKGGLPKFYRQMEKEIWTIAGKVLIPRYQKELRNLIRRWRKRHPNQFYIGGVGFDSFADMLGDSDFKDAAKSGFLLPEMNEATRSVDEARNLAERFAFFVKYLPYITRTSTETGIYDFLAQSETVQLLSDINRLTTAIEGIGITAKQLPDRLGEERKKLMDDLLKSEKKIRELSGDIRDALATGEKMASAANKAAISTNEAALTADKLIKRIHARSKPGSFKIMEWFGTFHEVSEAAKQAQTLVASVDKLLTDHGLEQRVPQLKKGFDAFLLRAFLWAALLIVFFFLALFVYRFLSQRFLIPRRKG